MTRYALPSYVAHLLSVCHLLSSFTTFHDVLNNHTGILGFILKHWFTVLDISKSDLCINCYVGSSIFFLLAVSPINPNLTTTHLLIDTVTSRLRKYMLRSPYCFDICLKSHVTVQQDREKDLPMAKSTMEWFRTDISLMDLFFLCADVGRR